MTAYIKGKPLLKMIRTAYEPFRTHIVGKTIVLIEFDMANTNDRARALAARVSANQKAKGFSSVGFTVRRLLLPFQIDRQTLGQIVSQINTDVMTVGAIMQMPAPPDALDAFCQIVDLKDLDGLKPGNRYFSSHSVVESALRLMHPFIQTSTTVAVVGGRGFIGSAIVRELMQLGVQCFIVEINDDPRMVSHAEVVVSAVGKPFLLDDRYLHKRHELVIDIGFAPAFLSSKRQFLGDVSPVVYSLVRRITPVPGGMGPIQIATLLERTLQLIPEHREWSFSDSFPYFGLTSSLIINH